MWTIELGFITGVMVGIEFISKEDSGGISAFIMDLGIIRFGIYYDHGEDE